MIQYSKQGKMKHYFEKVDEHKINGTHVMDGDGSQF